ncbi:MAG: OprD family outer membrane porin [Rhizobacter sp.]
MKNLAVGLMAALSAGLLALTALPANADEATAAPIPGRLDLLLRTYAEDLQIIDGARRHGVVQSGRLVYQSDFYGGSGGAGVGFDAGLYGAVRLDGDSNSRNMTHLRADGSGVHDTAWGYLGEYALKGKAAATTLKYGLQTVYNPYLQPYDIRALPPTFRGVSIVSTDLPGITLSGGSFDGVIPRGDDKLRGLSTAYAGLPFDRISYAGASAQFDTSSLALWASQSTDLWNQYYVSANKKLKFDGDFSVTGQFDSYLTRGSGARLAGPVNNNAVAVALTLQKGFSSVVLGYQAIHGDDFMDYTQETAGIYLSNSMGVDYNAPHERSLQLRYVFDGNRAGIPGWTLMAWTVRGFGVDGSASAAAHPDPNDPLHDLYWKNGEYVRGGHREWAVKSVYLVQDGQFKGGKIAFYVYRTRIDAQYPSKSFNDMQLMINYPIRLF